MFTPIFEACFNSTTVRLKDILEEDFEILIGVSILRQYD